MSGCVCAVDGCYNATIKNCTKSFFRFPLNNDLCKKWVVKCKRADLDDTYKQNGTEFLYKNYRICSDHFLREDFRNNKMFSQGLIKDAVPTKNLPGMEPASSLIKIKKEDPEDIVEGMEPAHLLFEIEKTDPGFDSKVKECPEDIAYTEEGMESVPLFKIEKADPDFSIELNECPEDTTSEEKNRIRNTKQNVNKSKRQRSAISLEERFKIICMYEERKILSTIVYVRGMEPAHLLLEIEKADPDFDIELKECPKDATGIEEISQNHGPSTSTSMITNLPTTNESTSNKRKRYREEKAANDEIIESIRDSVNAINCAATNRPETEIFGNFIASELRLFKNPRLQKRCKKEIIKVLMHFQDLDEEEQ